MLFPCIFSLARLNWSMIKLLEIFFDMKLDFKMNIMSMLDPKFATLHKMEQKMPFILESSPQNLMSYMNMVQLMQKIDEIQMLKGEYYIGAMLIIYSVFIGSIFF